MADFIILSETTPLDKHVDFFMKEHVYTLYLTVSRAEEPCEKCGSLREQVDMMQKLMSTLTGRSIVTISESSKMIPMFMCEIATP